MVGLWCLGGRDDACVRAGARVWVCVCAYVSMHIQRAAIAAGAQAAQKDRGSCSNGGALVNHCRLTSVAYVRDINHSGKASGCVRGVLSAGRTYLNATAFVCTLREAVARPTKDRPGRDFRVSLDTNLSVAKGPSPCYNASPGG